MKISDKNLRKISVSARDLLIETKPSSKADSSSLVESTEYTLNTEMVEFIRSIKNKYRVYLVTRLAQGNEAENKSSTESKEHEQIHELLMKLVK